MSKASAVILLSFVFHLASMAQNADSPPPVQADGNAPSPQWFDQHCRSLPVGNASPTLLTEVCQFALSVERQFPNFICDQTTDQYEPFVLPSGGHAMRHGSVITSTVTYVDGRESYSNVKVDGKHTGAGPLDVGGMRSQGEFATALRNLFDPGSKTHFSLVRETTFHSQPAMVFDFTVELENSHWVVHAGANVAIPAYHGQLWVTTMPSHIIRLDQDAIFERNFPYSTLSLVIDYAEVKLGDRGPFTLPVRSKITACRDRSAEDCLRNDIRFGNYRKFTAKAKVLPAEQ
jgi:hypothetical protein